MKGFILFIVCSVISIQLSAQQKLDTGSIGNVDSLTVSASEKAEDLVVEIDSLRSNSTMIVLEKERDYLRKRYDEAIIRIHEDSLKMQKQSKELSVLRCENDSLTKQLLKDDKNFVAMASNYLYLPYEAFSIEKIAIAAFEAVRDSTIRSNNLINYQLLKNYRQDIQSLLRFMNECQVQFDTPFGLPKEAQEAMNVLQSMDAYHTYKQFKGWEQTYLGKRFLQVESQLEKFDGRANKIDFQAIIQELETCLKTVNDL